MRKLIFTLLAASFLLTVAAQTRDIDKPTLTQRQQTELFNKNLEWKLDNVLPGIMRRENLEMWIIINFEYSEDPVYQTRLTPGRAMAPAASLYWSSTTRRGRIRKSSLPPLARGQCLRVHVREVSSATVPRVLKRSSQAVADYNIKKADPKEHRHQLRSFSARRLQLHQRTLSSALRAPLQRPRREYQSRLVSAKKVVIGWFETRTPWEVDFFRHMCGIGHDLIKEFFSNAVITPGVTTSADVQWWIVERIKEKKLDYWFFPSIDIKRSPADREKYGTADNIIRPGDMLHCDVGMHLQWEWYD
ncbi:MAG: hypothetical protein U5L72_01640 [Bacteroidales bacterium]|nr:hypothetical protein [Bacteroidales bacterium]